MSLDILVLYVFELGNVLLCTTKFIETVLLISHNILGLRRLEKYLNIQQDCLEKSLKIKFAYAAPNNGTIILH